MDRELLLLGVLRQADMHGYRLTEFIERDMGTCIDLKKPTAYYLLDKMVARGWVTRHEEREGARPPRQVYRLTAEGEALFQSLLRDNLAHYAPVRFASDIGLAYLDALPPEEALRLLAERRAALEAELDAAQGTPDHRGALHWLIEHRRFHLETELRWLAHVMRELQASVTPST